MIYQYAIVNTSTLEVVGKFVSPLAPKKMNNIKYEIIERETHEVLENGMCFLSKAQKYWDVVKDPLFSVNKLHDENKFIKTELI